MKTKVKWEDEEGFSWRSGGRNGAVCGDKASLGSAPSLSKDFLQNVQPFLLFDLPMFCTFYLEGVYLFLHGLKTTECSESLGSNRKDHDSTVAKFPVSSVLQELSTLQVSFKHK